MFETIAERLYLEERKDSINELAFRVNVSAWISSEFRFIQQKILIWKLDNDEIVKSESQIINCHEINQREIVAKSLDIFENACQEAISITSFLEVQVVHN
jgi:hypothetical protein